MDFTSALLARVGRSTLAARDAIRKQNEAKAAAERHVEEEKEEAKKVAARAEADRMLRRSATQKRGIRRRRGKKGAREKKPTGPLLSLIHI